MMKSSDTDAALRQAAAKPPTGRRTRKAAITTPLPRPVLANLAAAITQPFACVPDSDICKPPLMAARGEFQPGLHPAPPRRT